MKVSLALFTCAIVSASGAHVAVPQFVDSSTEQIVCSDPIRDTQPYYCFGAEYQDCSCWTETCGECLPQCCFKNKGNCPNNIDNAQCNVGPDEPPPDPTPTPPPFNRRAPSYCFVEPNIDCYPNTSGRPGCCWDDGGSNCPSFQPGCQAQPRQPTGMNYCTYGFDFNCYPQDGKPACCFQDGGMECPHQKPPCQRQPQPRGQNYCTWGFDYSCYPQLGRPQCCFENNGALCPPEPEPCVATTPTPKGGPPPPNTNPPGPNPRPPPNDDKKNLRFKALKGIDS